MIELNVQNLSWHTQGTPILRNVSLDIKQGELVALLGPNGAGKTSLIRCALGMQADYSGSVLLQGHPPEKLRPELRARLAAYLPQSRPMAWPLTVEATVALGRFAHGVNLGKLSNQDAAAVDQAITACDLRHLRHRHTDSLSGGELARVHCARAFATRAPLLIADEPIAALDPRHQYTIMALIRDYVDAGNGALIVLHDVGLAARFADRFIWLKAGEIQADGTPSDTLTQQRMADVYGVKARITQLDDHPSVTIVDAL